MYFCISVLFDHSTQILFVYGNKKFTYEEKILVASVFDFKFISYPENVFGRKASHKMANYCIIVGISSDQTLSISILHLFLCSCPLEVWKQLFSTQLSNRCFLWFIGIVHISMKSSSTENAKSLICSITMNTLKFELQILNWQLNKSMPSKRTGFRKADVLN